MEVGGGGMASRLFGAGFSVPGMAPRGEVGNAARAADESAEARRRALDNLSAALDAIPMKTVVEFRTRSEVSEPSKRVAMAAICMICGIDDQEPRQARQVTWETAHAKLGTPGRFMDGLRKFPYAVDAGSLPVDNVLAARDALEGIPFEQLLNEPLAQHLHQWILAAWRYCELAPVASLSAEPALLSAGTTPPLATPAPSPSPASSASISGPVSAPGSAAAAQPRAQQPATSPVRQAAPQAGVRSTRSALQPEQRRRTSPQPRAQIAPQQPPREAAREQAAPRAARLSPPPRTAAAVTRRASPPAQERRQTQTRRAGGPPPGAPATAPRTSQARSPPMRQARYVPPVSAQPRPGATPPGGSAPRVGVEDWRAKLEQVRRETREMKSMEAHLKWNMRREEDKQRKTEKQEDRRNHLVEQQDFRQGCKELDAERKAQQKITDIGESRDFQETKRAVKAAQKEEDISLVKESYLESKENSEYNVAQKKQVLTENAQQRIEEHLERYQVFAEYNLEEQQREKAEYREAQLAMEQQEMNHKMMHVKMERDRALASLEHLRTHQHKQVNSSHHLIARADGRFDC
eukprot:TRINITY_DN31566_c0_g1_i1.p1 TRINITY_DN31566_c0_g1~~TRINITY_DN31566_c0_g1_i1.p1  ORF type:complete len:578 (-),score=178.48 TRINITY_DN31566_c0_g1_i1:229-1962(-)